MGKGAILARDAILAKSAKISVCPFSLFETWACAGLKVISYKMRDSNARMRS